jgi:hypothetical protein
MLGARTQRVPSYPGNGVFDMEYELGQLMSTLHQVRVTRPGGRVVLSRVEDPKNPVQCKLWYTHCPRLDTPCSLSCSIVRALADFACCSSGVKLRKGEIESCLKKTSKKVEAVEYFGMSKEVEGEGNYCAADLYNGVISLSSR